MLHPLGRPPSHPPQIASSTRSRNPSSKANHTHMVPLATTTAPLLLCPTLLKQQASPLPPPLGVPVSPVSPSLPSHLPHPADPAPRPAPDPAGARADLTRPSPTHQASPPLPSALCPRPPRASTVLVQIQLYRSGPAGQAECCQARPSLGLPALRTAPPSELRRGLFGALCCTPSVSSRL